MMYLSRHIYLLGAALVNVALGLYLETRPEASRRALQGRGSLLIAASPALLLMAFWGEPSHGIAGRTWRSHLGLYALFAGMMLHLVAAVRTPNGGKPS